MAPDVTICSIKESIFDCKQKYNFFMAGEDKVLLLFPDGLPLREKDGSHGRFFVDSRVFARRCRNNPSVKLPPFSLRD